MLRIFGVLIGFAQNSPPRRGGVDAPSKAKAQTGWSDRRDVCRRTDHPGASRHPSCARRGIAALSVCIFLFNAVLLRADDEPKSKAQITKTERVDFPPGGVLRLNNSIGELTVEGWDRPEIEITTIKSSKASYGLQERENATRNLNQIQIKTERHGAEVVVTTEFPRYAIFPPPVPWHSGHANFDLEYRINAPRDARLVVEHNSGEVHIDNLMGDIQATVLKGAITLRLPEDNSYAIDAKSDAGGIFSAFPGQLHRRLGLFGRRFAEKPSAGAHKLYLRVGFGDIAILKIQKPPYARFVGLQSAPQQ
jgi:hypothetical protein